MVFTYFASFEDYEDYIFEIIFYVLVRGSKIGGKMDWFGRQLKKN